MSRTTEAIRLSLIISAIRLARERLYEQTEYDHLGEPLGRQDAANHEALQRLEEALRFARQIEVSQ